MTCTWFQIQINHAYACLASSCRTGSMRQCKCSTAGGRGPHPHPQGAIGKGVTSGAAMSPGEVGSGGGGVCHGETGGTRSGPACAGRRRGWRGIGGGAMTEGIHHGTGAECKRLHTNDWGGGDGGWGVGGERDGLLEVIHGRAKGGIS
jgi:hypothetical protein